MDETITYTLRRVEHIEAAETRFSCDHCGYPGLKNLYHLLGSNGKEVIVGSECAPKLLSGADLKAARDVERNIKQAGREWKKAYPPTLSNESREHYINRRLVEIPNAAAARREWNHIRNPYDAAKCRLSAAGIQYPGDYTRYGTGSHYLDHSFSHHFDWNVRVGHEGYAHDCWLCRQQEALFKAYERETRIEQTRMIREIAIKYGANPYDLTSKAWLEQK